VHSTCFRNSETQSSSDVGSTLAHLSTSSDQSRAEHTPTSHVCWGNTTAHIAMHKLTRRMGQALQSNPERWMHTTQGRAAQAGYSKAEVESRTRLTHLYDVLSTSFGKDCRPSQQDIRQLCGAIGGKRCTAADDSSSLHGLTHICNLSCRSCPPSGPGHQCP
jgi:hypothetical protein